MYQGALNISRWTQQPTEHGGKSYCIIILLLSWINFWLARLQPKQELFRHVRKASSIQYSYIGNVELMQERSPEHLRMGTARTVEKQKKIVRESECGKKNSGYKEKSRLSNYSSGPSSPRGRCSSKQRMNCLSNLLLHI